MLRYIGFGLLLALLMFLRGWDSLKVKSATYDEWGHLQNGLAFLRGGDDRFPIDPTVLINPPLARMLAASPIRTGSWAEKGIPPKESFSCRAERKSAERLAAFPFNFDVDTIDLLRLSRLPILLFSLLGIPLLFLLSSELGFARAGPWAALVYSFSPNILAHARLVTPDLPVTVLILATVLVWLRLARAPSWGRSVIAGAVLGLSLATKYSAVLLVPVLAMVWVVAQRGRRLSAFGWSVAAGVTAGLIVIVIYGAVVLPALGKGSLKGEHSEEVERYAFFMDTWGGRNLAMPIVLYRYGAVVAGRAVMKSFLVGHHRFGGWLSYFPIAMCTKTPMAVLLTLSLGLGWSLRIRRLSDRVLLWIAGFPVLYMAITLAKGIQVGVRHILPVYPFIALASGFLLAAWWSRGGKFRIVSVILTLLLLLEGMAIHPHYLANFNLGAGGPDGGYNYLVDCNLDWGQDLPAVAEYQHGEEIDRLVFSYFGTDDPEKYGITYDLLCPPLGGKKPPPGVYAVSATNRQGLYLFPNSMEHLAWFRGNKPTQVVAHTMLIYDLR